METTEYETPACVICLRNGNNITRSVYPLKYGVNTIGRGLNNDIVLKNLNVSRIHCHLRIEKIKSKYIAYIKDIGTSNGTIVENITLSKNIELQLNDLNMIVLANSDEGVVLQFIDHKNSFSNLCNNQINNKRKVSLVENSDEPTTVKMPKLVFKEEQILDEPLLNNKNPSNTSKSLDTITNNLQHLDSNQLILSHDILEPVKNSGSPTLSDEKPKIIPINNTKPSSTHKNNMLTSIKIKTEPSTINNVFSQGTYRNEEDSVIVIYSSEEEDDINESNSGLSNIKIKEEQNNLNTISTINYPSTSNGKNLNVPNWSNQCQNDEIIISDEDDDVIYVPSNSNSNNTNCNAIIESNDSDSTYKCTKIIDSLPIKHNTMKIQATISDNESIIKTRAKTQKIINDKKIAEEMTINQNKKIIEERRIKLQQLAKNKCITSSTERKLSTNETNETNEDYINQPSTSEKLHIKNRISKLQNNCVPSTSKSNVVSTTNNQITQHLSNSDNCLFTNINNQLIYTYFDTLSIICKWNAAWLREEKLTDHPPPLVKSITKMKGQFENVAEYSNIVKPLLLYEIWSKISDSYNMIISKNPSLEKCIFEKSPMKDIDLLSFKIQSVNKEFSTSAQTLKSINGPLWCLKCIEIDKKKIMDSRFSFKGQLCIVIIHSNSFESNIVKRPTKSKNIFFGYINVARKIGFHSNTQLYIELIITKKTEQIPNGTTIQLMNILYLHSELRLFQAINNVAKTSLNNMLITPQLHNYTINSKTNLKNYNINSLMLNNSQKEAVKMAVTICSSEDPNIGLIIGPPGTGKTNVICDIVTTLISKLQTNSNTKHKFLVCAPSNEAVDAIVKRIIEIKNNMKQKLQFNIVRVGSEQKYDLNSPIMNVMLNNLVRERMNNPSDINLQGTSSALSIFTNKQDIEKSILQNADIILTTLNSCFSKSMEETFIRSTNKTLNNCQFTACIVDEAGQCIEPLNCVPLLLGINKLILVGDDKQLQPVIKSKLAKDNGLGISLFKRLITWFKHKGYTQKQFPTIFLDTQYRMHPEICLFPSTYFYNGAVKTAPSVKTRMHLPFQPYIILEHESQQDNSGEINIGEACMIVNIIEILLNSKCNSLTIAILTPYHKQREQLNNLLEKKKISLNVNTIDSFQGSECDVLLISTVRTNGVGFMDDICRLNVALTRAKQSLIICGNFMSLKFEQVWHDLIEDAKKRKLIKKVSKRTMVNSRALFALIKY